MNAEDTGLVPCNAADPVSKPGRIKKEIGRLRLIPLSESVAVAVAEYLVNRCDGYGSGSGSGYGDGYGSGSGYGDGYGDGYGSGSGSGDYKVLEERKR